MSMSNETEEIRIESAIQLLVEGNDERNFFEALIEHHSKKLSIEDIQIQNFKGGTQFNTFLRLLVNSAGFHEKVRSIGIVRDAEDSAKGAFESVQAALRNANAKLLEDDKLPVPDCPEKRKEDDKLAVEVLILPGGNQKGMLETLLCESFAGTKIDDCISEFFQCVKPLLEKPIKHYQKDKARAFAYLTTRPNPHHSVGVAAEKKWDLDSPVFGRARSFLERIAVLPEIE